MRRETETKLVRQAMREQRKLLIAYRDPRGSELRAYHLAYRVGFFSLGG